MKTFEKLRKLSPNFPDYLLLAISLGIIYSALIYYLYALNYFSIALIIILSATTFKLLEKRLFKDESPKEIATERSKNSHPWSNRLLFSGYFLLCLLSLIILIRSLSDQALISPWQVVSSKFFTIYTISSLALAFLLLRKALSPTSKLIALSAHYFISFSVAAIVYKIGYGFDPFVHGATMELISDKGLVTPKPFYYLGQYGLIVTLHKLTGISIWFLNRFLLPILAALFLPLAVYRLTSQVSDLSSRLLTPLFILMIGFSPFIITTPQNLSYLFLILAISFSFTKNSHLWPLVLSMAALAIHPLTGIPSLGWYLFLSLKKVAPRFRPHTYKLLTAGLFIGNMIILPLALFISGGNNFKEFNWSLGAIISPLKSLFSTLNSAGSESWLLNLTYFFKYNYNLLLILFLIVSLIYFYHHKKSTEIKSLIAINLSLTGAYLISSQIIFTDLISYEQGNFAGRILTLITIFFLPILIFGLEKLISLILQKDRLTKYLWLALGITLVSTSLYTSYPRFDRYFNSRGYSTSQNDLSAVKLIAANTKNPYIVLANQQVSAAALKEFGFNNYYQTALGPVFFYPIPTGGPLYNYYLDMVYKNPSRATMAKARELTGVNESYLIVNKYWHQSGRIINAAKLSADSWQEIGGDVYLFKYLP